MNKVKLPKWEGSPLLPSAFQLGEYVHVSVGERSVKYATDNLLKNGKVIKIHFAPGKVCYDLEFTVAIDNVTNKRYTTRIHNVDGALCEPVIEDSTIRTPDQNSFYDNILWSLEKSLEEIGNYCFQRGNFSATEWNRIIHNLNKDLNDSPLNHGGWHNSTDLPNAKEGAGNYASVDVLCDVNGKRKEFRVGWYDFEDREWRFHDDDQSWLEVKHLKWAYIPISV